MWLAPYVNTKTYAAVKNHSRVPNSLTISFEKASMNIIYKDLELCKDAFRGVEEFELTIDDKLAYRGFLQKAGI